MKAVILLSCFAWSYFNYSYDTDCHQKQPPDNLLDSIRIESNTAWVLFHHPKQKKSLVCHQVNTREGIDSLLNYLGTPLNDTTCLRRGFNHFGQIDLYRDSTRKERVAQIHFILKGNCAGFYLEIKKQISYYRMTPEGLSFISALFNKHKKSLQ